MRGRSASATPFSSRDSARTTTSRSTRRRAAADERSTMLAMLLTHILPMPVMLLAANRRSTGIGVRPRSNRIEVTADFTPDAALMIAAATVIVGIAREVMTWPSFELDELELARHSGRRRLHARAAQLAQRMGRALLVVRRESVCRRRERTAVERRATAIGCRCARSRPAWFIRSGRRSAGSATRARCV